MRRRLALLVVLVGVIANAYLDYLLFLQNPAELEEVVRVTLRKVAPDYDPKMLGPFEFSLFERRVVISGLRFHERGNPERVLLEVGRVEATLGGIPPAVERLVLHQPRASLRIDREGNLNLPRGSSSADAAPPELSEMEVEVKDAWLRVQNDFEGQGSDVLLADVDLQLSVGRDQAVSGRGSARLGALYDFKDPLAAGGRAVATGSDPGLADRRYQDLFPQVELAVDRRPGEPLQVQVGLRGGTLSPQLRSLIPPLFQRTIWAELNPSGGELDAVVRARVGVEGVKVNASVRPRGVTVQPRGFSIPIREVGGPFEVVVSVPQDGPPELLGVTWENVRGSVSGGTCLSRGQVWPGSADEKVTLFLYVDAQEIALTPPLVAAMPADIRAVYQRFDPQGTVGRAKVLIFKGPFHEEPQISVQVAELLGTLSATYEDYPVRLHEVEGSFSLKEGANVEVRASGRLDLGGRAEVEAMVMHGDLIHVEVRGHDVPLGTRILDVLSPGVRRYVAPFHPEGGRTNFKVVVEKPGARALARPHVELDLQGVTVAHDLFPYRLAATGKVVVDPVFPPDVGPDDDPDPARIDVQLDLGLQRTGAVEGARLVGPLSVPLGEAELTCDLAIGARRIELGSELLEALPSGPREVAEVLRPSGALVGLAGRVRALERFEVDTRGEGLLVAPGPEGEPGRARQFVVEVERARVCRDGPRLRLENLKARAPGGGEITGTGEVLKGVGDESRTVALDLSVRDALLDQRALELLPAGEARDALARLEARGRVDARVRLRSAPGVPDQHLIELGLRGVEARVHGLAPALAGLEREPVRDLRGELRVELPRGVDLIGLRGRLAGAQVEVAGRVGVAPPAPPPGPAACLGGPGGAVLGLLGERLAPPFDLSLSLTGYRVDERTATLGGPPVQDALARFPASGPLDLRARIHRAAADATPAMRVRIEPRGLRVVPALLPVPCEQVEGVLELVEGAPVLIDLRGAIGQGRFRLRRDRAAEGRLPEAGASGMALAVDLVGFARPGDARAFEAELPERFRAALGALDPRGPVDVRAQVYLPEAPERAIVWVAEVRPHALALSAGLRLEGIEGALRLSGRLTELERGSLEGELELAQLGWKRQIARNLRGRVRLRDGVLSVGVRGAAFAGEIYGGQLVGLVEYAVQTGAYEGWVKVDQASMARAVDELGRLREPESGGGGGGGGGGSGPVKGSLDAWLHFLGGGVGLDGRPREFQGRGEIQAKDTNLVKVPGLDLFRGLADAVRGESTAPLAFDTIDVDYRTDGRKLFLDHVRLDSRALALTGAGGWVRFSEDPELNGDIRLDLVPLDTGVNVITLFLRQNLIPLTGYSVRGKVWDVTVVTGIPFFAGAEGILVPDEEGDGPR